MLPSPFGGRRSDGERSEPNGAGPRRGLPGRLALARGGPFRSAVEVYQNTATRHTRMTHQNDSDLLNSILQQLNDSGLDALLGGFATLLNEAMLRQRSEALGAQPYERSDARKGHANGFKPKTVLTRMGPLELADFIGLDTCLAVMNVLHEGLADTKYRPCPLLVKYVEAGWLGRKTGRGFYDYSGDTPEPTR